jgi:hypothetical protein
MRLFSATSWIRDVMLSKFKTLVNPFVYYRKWSKLIDLPVYVWQGGCQFFFMYSGAISKLAKNYPAAYNEIIFCYWHVTV